VVAKPPITPSPTQPTTADDLQKQLFLSQPSAVLQRMIQNGEIPVSNPKVQNGLVQFFANQPNFNIRKTSVNKAFTAPEAFNGIPANVVPNVKNEMASLQRLQALTSNPDTISICSMPGSSRPFMSQLSRQRNFMPFSLVSCPWKPQIAFIRTLSMQGSFKRVDLLPCNNTFEALA